MGLSVVVPARNEERWLSAQLDALLSQDFEGEWEIIVADNGSTDATASIVAGYAAQSNRIRLLDAGGNTGKAQAMNFAVESTTANNIAFCDADDVVAGGWLSAIASGIEDHSVVTGPNELHLLNPPWLATSRGKSAEESIGSFASIFPCIRGNNFALRRSVWYKLNGMNSGYFPCEDIEFSMRCWLNEIEVVGLPDAVVHYRYRAGARDLWKQGFAYGSNRPQIAKLLRDAGKPVPAKFSGWKSWLALFARLPTVCSKNGRASWVWIAGNRWGQVVGSFRHGIVML